MMYCLRSYIPLLLLPLPLSLSPLHLTILLLLTYFLNRPCIYCSFLLVILFASSCHWSGRCFVDFSLPPPGSDSYGYATWFLPKIYIQDASRIPLPNDHHDEMGGMVGFLEEVANTTVATIAGAALEKAKGILSHSTAVGSSGLPESTGVGIGWLRRLLGRNEWTLPCVDVKIRL